MTSVVVSAGAEWRTAEVCKTLSNPIPHEAANPHHQKLTCQSQAMLHRVPLGVGPVVRTKTVGLGWC